MRYAFLITIFISLAIIVGSTIIEVAETGVSQNLFGSIYHENTTAFFFLDTNSSFYDIYSFREAPYLLLRKIGHFLLYGFITGIIFLVLPVQALWLKVSLALTSSTFIGLIDEVHQHFLINRGGRLLDVYINAAGSLVSVFILAITFTALKNLRS